MRKVLLCPTALVLAVLGGCDLPPPRGPAWGEWKGTQPGVLTNYPRHVDLTLEGSPDAASGRYDVRWLAPDPGFESGNQEQRWADTYQRRQQILGGQSRTVIVLQNAPNSVVAEYALFPDGTLHAVQPGDGLGNNPRLDALYTLRPVPHPQ